MFRQRIVTNRDDYRSDAIMSAMSTKKNPLGPTGDAVRLNIKRLREERGLSYAALSRGLAEVDRPIPTLGLSRIESGQRRVDADDLAALAVVLGVHPVGLLLPFTGVGTVEITGAGTVPARDAWKWAEGRRPLQAPADDDGTAEVDFQKHARPKGIRTYQMNPAGEEAAEEDGVFEAFEAMGAKKMHRQEGDET